MKSFLIGLLGGFVAVVVALLLMPLYSEYSSRAESSEWLLNVGTTKSTIAENIVRLKSVTNSGVDVKAPSSMRFDPDVTIRSDGIIVVHGKNRGQLFVLIPDYIAGKVTWTCLGGSARDVPAQCRAH